MEESPDSEIPLKRRRGPAYVTTNACVECKRKKAKCDGDTPCGRCVSQGDIVCSYETPVRLRKETLREEIKDLKEQLQQSETTIQRLSTMHTSGFSSHQESMVNPFDFSTLSMSDFIRDQSQGSSHRPSMGNWEPQNQLPPLDQWTEVTSNQEFIEHLSTLYFRWEYPLFASVSKGQFLRDFRAGRQRYCSPLLVNALLSVGCRFSERPESRSDPSDADSGAHFFAEAKRLLAEEPDDSLLRVQALGLMSIREASCGRDSESWFYSGQAIRIAIEMGLHKPFYGVSTEEEQVRNATFWGAFTLDQAWSLTVGRLPHFSLGADRVPKPLNIDQNQTSDWLWETEHGVAPEQPSQQSTDVRPIYNCFCMLSEIIHSSLYTLYTPTSAVNSTDVLNIYTRYLEWYGSLPDALRVGGNPSPAALFIHMYYHYALLMVFRPFINLHFLHSGLVPRDVCLQAADNISSLVQSYKRLYSLRCTPAFVPYIALASTIVHLMSTDSIIPTSRGTAQVQQGAADLQEMSSCNPFGIRALNILKVLAKHWGVAVSLGNNSSNITDPEQMCQPLSGSMNFFCPNQEALLLRSVQDHENSPVFTPFPLQGLPMIAVDEVSLGNAGFTLRKARQGPTGGGGSRD